MESPSDVQRAVEWPLDIDMTKYARDYEVLRRMMHFAPRMYFYLVQFVYAQLLYFTIDLPRDLFEESPDQECQRQYWLAQWREELDFSQIVRGYDLDTILWMLAIAIRDIDAEESGAVQTTNPQPSQPAPPTALVPATGPLRPLKILDHLLDQMDVHDSYRYGEWLANHPVANRWRVETMMRREVYELFQQGPYTLQDLINIGGDTTYNGPGVYLHIIYSEGRIRNYVGQSVSLLKRIHKEHMNPRYRERNPSLHYEAMENMEWDAWVVLATARPGDRIQSAFDLRLNVAEMFAAVLFQSLPHKLLRRYLPAQIALGPEVHLNVASPLGGKVSTAIALAGLMNSSDPVHKRYLEKRKQRKLARPARGKNEECRRKLLEGYVSELVTDVYYYGVYCKFAIREASVHLGRRDNFLGDTVHIRADIVPVGSVHPEHYAKLATADDPASRLAFCVTGVAADGSLFQHWPRTEGEKFVFKANSWCDWLEGVPESVIAMTPRRHIIPRKAAGHMTFGFTADEVVHHDSEAEEEESQSDWESDLE